MIMKPIFDINELSDEEVLKVLNKALNAESIEEKEAKRTAKRRKAKADFCNLNEKTISDVVFF